MAEVIAPKALRNGNERADAATALGMVEHPEELRAFVMVCEARAAHYRPRPLFVKKRTVGEGVPRRPHKVVVE
jgi:hypothetical protein